MRRVNEIEKIVTSEEQSGFSSMDSSSTLSNALCLHNINASCPGSIVSKTLKTKFHKDLSQEIKSSIFERKDDEDMVNAILSKYEEAVAHIDPRTCQEFTWWSNPEFRPLTELRRLVFPIEQNVPSNNVLQNDTESTKNESTSLGLTPLKIYLRVDKIQIPLIKDLITRLKDLEAIERTQPRFMLMIFHLRKRILDHMQDLADDETYIDNSPEFIQLLPAFCASLEDPNGQIHSFLSYIKSKRNKNQVEKQNATELDEFILPNQFIAVEPQQSPSSVKDIQIENILNKKVHCNARKKPRKIVSHSKALKWINALPPPLRNEELKIGAEAKTLIYEAAQKYQGHADFACRKSFRHPKMKNRAFDGSLVFDSDQISRDNFIARTKFMNRVNEKFKRRFIPGSSKPMMKQLRFAKETLSEIRSIFFDEDGSLHNCIMNDIDISINNDPRLISFGKLTASSVRDDKRWQVSIRKHGLGSSISTRAKIEEIYEREGILAPSNDEVHDLSILIGGTEDQRLHHDVARQMAIWYNEKPTMDTVEREPPLTGWEVDRIEYNQAMESAFPPCSILIGMGKSGDFLLGIQKDQIILLLNGTHCQVVGGCGSTFKIVRSNHDLVVVIVPIGCMFTGDFPHCGVRNIENDSPESELMERFNNKINTVLKDIPARERVIRSQKIIQMMCKFPRLDALCRIHSSTQMVDGTFRQPRNAVGFSYCQINERDARCKENDSKTIN